MPGASIPKQFICSFEKIFTIGCVLSNNFRIFAMSLRAEILRLLPAEFSGLMVGKPSTNDNILTSAELYRCLEFEPLVDLRWAF